MRAIIEILRKVYERTPVCGGVGRLKSGNFKSQIGERAFSLARELLVRWRSLGENFPRDSETLAVYEVGR